MGEISEMVIEGILCSLCGCFMNTVPPGHPVLCKDCQDEPDLQELDFDD